MNAGTRPHLFIFLQLCVVDLSDLGEFGSVVGMFDGIVTRPARRRSCSCSSCRPSTFFWSCHTLRQEHVVQTHKLGVWGILLLGTADAETCSDT